MSKILQLKMTSQRALLREAQQNRKLVRLRHKKLEFGSFCGYVGGVGREFVLLWTINDALYYDGMYAMRHCDITELEVPDKRHAFVRKVLAIKKIEPKTPGNFPLDTIHEVIQGAGQRSPVISVYINSEEDSEGCYVGRFLGVEENGFTLQGISTDAVWMSEPSCFTWDKVSTVSMEEGYTQALLMVAGDPPPLTQSDTDMELAY